MTIPISFEFFPPKTQARMQHLLAIYKKLSVLSPEFSSITYGAIGSHRQRTIGCIETLIKYYPNDIFYPHLVTVDTDKKTMQSLLNHYHNLGINGIVALRGDEVAQPTQTDFLPDAAALVKYTRQHYPKQKIYVAAYPEIHPLAKSAQADIDVLKAKADNGADAAITQFFYNPNSYLQLVNELEKQGCQLPIIPGIMPITNAKKLIKFADECGADVPRWIQKRLISYQNDPASLESFTTDVVTQLCQQLIEFNAPSLHFYTMSQPEPILAIAKRLGILSN